jgi:diguanylate cyclase (GGDEF)-like protein/PAS domain S-box-containing protein
VDEAEVNRDATAAGAPHVDDASLSSSEHWFEQLVANSSDLLVVLDAAAVLTYANPASRQRLGFEKDSQTGRNVFNLIHADDHVVAADAFAEALERGGSTSPMVIRVMTAEGQWRFVEVVLTNCLEDPAIRGIVANGYDVTERNHLTRALQILSAVHRILVNATDENALIADLCSSLVAQGAIRLAWVGFIEPGSGAHLRPVAAAGRTEFLDEGDAAAAAIEFLDGVIGEVVRTGTARVVNDVRREPELSRWWDLSESAGLLSACSFPLRIGDRTVGALTIHSDEVGFFGDDEVGLFRELADELAYGIGRLRDAARLEKNERLLRDSEERFRLAFEANAAPMLFSDLEDRIIAVNNAFCRMIGFSREELLGHDSKQFTYPEDIGITEESLERLMSSEVDQVRYVKRYLHKDGHMVTAEVSRSPARDASGQILYFVASERDVTEERALAAQLSHQALHDPLTGLANRTLFEDRLAQAHERVARHGGRGAILLLDLDDFKGINDTYGHLAGDELLVAFARRVKGVTRSSDTLCRFGGDEFLYLAEGLSDLDEVGTIAQRFLDALTTPFAVGGKMYLQRVSIGVAVFDGASEDADELLRDADLALYEAKSRGKARHVVFEPSMREEAANYYELTRELREALGAGALAVHFQPVVDLAASSVVGFEALMRWAHPARGEVPPSQFIPLAEESDFVVALGAFTLFESVAAAAEWDDGSEGTAPFVAVNATARQFLDRGFVSLVDEVLATYSVDGSRLVVEIAEDVALRDAVATARVVGELRSRGVRVALDDFGAGCSSLSSLAALSPDIVKIDVSVVNAPEASVEGGTLLETIISFAARLGCTVFAEGVETTESLERLRALGCTRGQGFLFSAALERRAVAAALAHPLVAGT